MHLSVLEQDGSGGWSIAYEGDGPVSTGWPVGPAEVFMTPRSW